MKQEAIEKKKAEEMAYHLARENDLAEWKVKEQELAKEREEKNKREKERFRETLKEKQMKIRAELQEVERATIQKGPFFAGLLNSNTLIRIFHNVVP